MQNEVPLVAVIDDDEPTCRAVARLLDAIGYRVRTYTAAREYLEETDAASPTCVLVDIRMPDVDGLSLIRTMHSAGNDVPTVFMTGSGHVPTVVEAMKEGALDLLAKPFTADALRAAIFRASESAGKQRDDLRAIANVWHQAERLTPREAEVCALVACGLLNKRVAARLGTKEKTVKVHRGRVMQKLQLNSLAELVRFVDSLYSARARQVIKLDGAELVRPRAADIIIDVTSRDRALTTPVAVESVDQRAMTRAR